MAMHPSRQASHTNAMLGRDCLERAWHVRLAGEKDLALRHSVRR
jgi:hypothetical protein